MTLFTFEGKWCMMGAMKDKSYEKLHPEENGYMSYGKVT